MSLETSQKPVNGAETLQQDTPATTATEAIATNVTNPKGDVDAPGSLDDSAGVSKGAINGTADAETVSAGQPLEAPVEPTKPVQSEEPLPKGQSESSGAGAEVQNNGVSAARDTSSEDGAKGAENIDIDNSESKLPASDPTTIGDISAKDSEGQAIDATKAEELASVQESAKHGHDDDQEAVEEQPPAKKQKTSSVKATNGADSKKALKRGASQKKKESKQATTENGQPRRSSRLAS